MRVTGGWVGFLGAIASFALVGCGGSSSSPVAGLPVDYQVLVMSTNPGLGVVITASPADTHGSTGGFTNLRLSYAAGTAVTLTAPASSGTTLFGSWMGCSPPASNVCSFTVTANTLFTAGYVDAPKGVAQVTVTPAVASIAIGSGQQFTAVAGGSGTFDSSVTWSVAAAAGSSADPGTITSSGSYQTPYPAPPSVVVTATSNADPTVSGSATVTLAPPALATGPALSVDAGAVTHPISPLIYSMNEYSLDPSIATKFHLAADRWGGDGTTRYNYLLDVSNAASDYYFTNILTNNTAYPDTSQTNTQIGQDEASNTKTILTVPMTGWVTKRVQACSYSVAKYGAQTAVNPNQTDCGTGTLSDGTAVKNDPTDTSQASDQTFTSGWVHYLTKKYGTAENGGVYEYELDNEPEYWSGVHKDVHPNSLTYDELTNKGIAYASAIKAADPSAAVGGPVISNFDDYFYSWTDLVSGWGTGPCYCYNGNPTDRNAHGGTSLMDYYLQQFQKQETTGGVRLLDYLDLHGYYAANNAAFALAGDTALQEARLDSTRAMWDPSYVSGYTDPNTAGSSAAQVPVELITRMKNWVAADYPGTKTAITEYNWGGQEHINGALAQADLLGIFGREGLDEGVLWGPPDPVKQVPGLEAFVIYRNYDGAGSEFGDTSVTSTSGNQGQLAIYGATRSSDGAVTMMVINKTFGDLTSTLSLANFVTKAQASVYLYSGANTASIVAQPSQALTAPAAAGGASTLTLTFPAASITLLVVPKS
jgi:hypothetical protein